MGMVTYNRSAIQNILSKHAKNDMTDDQFNGQKRRFMSKPIFNVWWDGHYHKKLDKGNIETVRSFVNQYEFEKEYFV